MALLIFIAGVLRKVMNDMDEPEFKYFLGSLCRSTSFRQIPIHVYSIDHSFSEQSHISISTVSVAGGSQQVLHSGW